MTDWKHVKRGTSYREIGRAELQAAQPITEGCVLVIYQGSDGKLWAREENEFADGRFEEITPTPEEDARNREALLQHLATMTPEKRRQATAACLELFFHDEDDSDKLGL